MSFVEGDQTDVRVFMSDGRRHDHTVDQLVQSTAATTAIAQASKYFHGQFNKALDAIDSWAKRTPSVRSIAGAGGYGSKIRVVFITEGDDFSEPASDALEELSIEVFGLLKDTPFTFRYYLIPESAERSARATFLGDMPESDDTSASEQHD